MSQTVGSGPDTLALRVSQDAYNGSAQYTVSVDGKQVGRTLTASALRGSGQTDAVAVKGDWAAGGHTVTVNFLNDAWGGTASADRNLYVEGATYNGATVDGAAKALLSAGPASFGFTEPSTPPPPTGASAATVGSGPDSLVLRVSQDAYQGSAQYTVKVDGAQIGGVQTAQAAHNSGQSDALTVKGDWLAGTHRVEVQFLNDAWGGSASADRNFYVDGAAYNGEPVPNATKALLSAGSAGFDFTEGGPPPPPVGPSPAGEFGTQAVWGDEFNGTALDRSKWPVVFGGDQLYWNGAFRWDSRMISVGNGSLNIGLEKQSDGIWETSGVLAVPQPSWGAPGFPFTHGKVEIRAKASQEMDGAGPAFLLWPASNDHWPPEVDILETPHGRGMFTNHWAGPNGEDTYETTQFDLDYSQWHVYGLEWTPGRLTMTVDGNVMKTYTSHIPTEAMSVGLQGHADNKDGWYGNANATGVNRLDISVDYVRVYEYSPAG